MSANYGVIGWDGARWHQVWPAVETYEDAAAMAGRLEAERPGWMFLAMAG